MEFRGPRINHLSFADDIIFFVLGRRKESLQLIMDTLTIYEASSDQLINKGKSHFMVPKDTPPHIIDMYDTRDHRFHSKGNLYHLSWSPCIYKKIENHLLL